ncbi:MAG TPA: RluA family pseudouridine synthase [Acetobacteraceae bacterium]|nr:RluA family pseudouridine synthase [Acetobacteraceae bacterium]
MSVDHRIVAVEEAEIRLDRWFRRHFPGLTQGAIERLCRTGQVRVDGKRIAAATRLEAGQEVRIPPLHVGPQIEAPRGAALPDPKEARALAGRILYRDDWILVLDKPAGLPVQGGPGIVRHLDAMLEALRDDAPERPRLVHRLDRDTAGVMVLARSAAAAARLAASFRGRDVVKTYWAVVVGRPLPPAGRIDMPLVRSQGTRFGRTALAEGGEGATAVTSYRTLDRAGNRFAWLELMPRTGRTHQLRVHCAALGTPILGDVTYGGEKASPAGFPTMLHLFARGLSFPHPAGGRLTAEAPLPTHLAETFHLLGFTAPPPAPPARVSR